MLNPEELNELVAPLRDDLTSGAAEIALRSIGVFQATLAGSEDLDAEEVKSRLSTTARALIDAQPAMAPLFHLGNSVLNAVAKATTAEEVHARANEALEQFDRRMCQSAEAIADQVFDLVPPGELVFAYSFSSTVVSSLLNARSRGKYFRVLCTEARPALEGRKLATMLASGGLEVIHTFDTAIGLALPMCRA